MKTEEIIKAAQAYYPRGILHEEAKVSSFVRGAKWADKTMLDRACEWIKTNMDDYIHVEYDTVTGMPTNEAYIANKKVVEDFKNYMEGGVE